MAQVVYTYTPTAGALFNTAGWNTDVWSSKDGESVFGELNGHIEDDNFDPGFEIGPQHMRPGEPSAMSSGYWRITSEYYDTLFGTGGVGTASEEDWRPITGASCRLYVPWDAQAVIYSVSLFFTNQRQRETTDPVPAVAEWGGPEMFLRMNIDGAGIDHTRRYLPYTAYPTNNPGAADSYISRENCLTQHLDLVHMATGGDRVSQGWHDVWVECLIPQTQDVEQLIPRYKKAPHNAIYQGRHRLRVGVRSARIIAL